jgi:hypothetical protein
VLHIGYHRATGAVFLTLQFKDCMKRYVAQHTQRTLLWRAVKASLKMPGEQRTTPTQMWKYRYTTPKPCSAFLWRDVLFI